MKAIICGANRVGYNIAAYLSADDNDIIVIDDAPERIAYTQETLDVQAVLGQGSYPDVLASVGAQNADLLIAVTASDEQNIIACQVAASLFNIPIRIASVRSQSYLDSPWLENKDSHLSIDYVISPERQVAKAILANLDIPGVMEVIHLQDSSSVVLILHFHPHSPLNNMPLQHIGEEFEGLPFKVLGIMRQDSLIIPQAHDQLHAGDDAYIIVEKDKLSRLLAVFGVKSTPLNKVIIGGGGNVGLFLAQSLTKYRPSVIVKIIEQSKERGHFLAQNLENVVVLHGNAIDINVLKEANVTQADMYVAVTNDDAANILSSLLAKNLGKTRATTLVSNMTYPKFLPSLGVDSIMNPGFITISSVLNHIRRGNIRTAHVLQGGFGEILEATIPPESKLVGELFGVFNAPDQSVVGGCVRNNVFFIPKSHEEIHPHDHLIILVTCQEHHRIEKMFRVKR